MFRKTILPTLRMLLVLTLLTGVLYPLLVTGVGGLLFPAKAAGGLLEVDGYVRGSELIGQANTAPTYFWGRPSAINYAPLPSSGTNTGATNAALAHVVVEREAAFREANGLDTQTPIPAEMLTASASGLDPHISPEAARLQVNRVAEARGLDAAQVAELVEQHIEGPQFGLFGQARVNVLLLNLALDEME